MNMSLPPGGVIDVLRTSTNGVVKNVFAVVKVNWVRLLEAAAAFAAPCAKATDAHTTRTDREANTFFMFFLLIDETGRAARTRKTPQRVRRDVNLLLRKRACDATLDFSACPLVKLTVGTRLFVRWREFRPEKYESPRTTGRNCTRPPTLRQVVETENQGRRILIAK